MDIHTLRQQLKTKSIYDIHMRVTFYARVSSESDEQLNSLGNQISYYEELIKQNKAWTYVDGYIDEGISGISTKKRENFNSMIEAASRDMFDLVITKEISRFARNTLDSIQYTRDLLSHGVCVFFQNDNINTADEDSELRLAIMSSIAQDELRKLSSRIKFGHQQAIKNHVVLGNSRMFGYVKNNKKLAVDEEQAVMVRELFTLYATGKYSMKQIETIFWDKGYRNYRGNKIAHTTMSNIISNPKYKGYYVGNKVKIVDMFTKQQKFLPPDEWVMFKDETGNVVPAIVSEDLWDTANKVLKTRSDDIKGRQGICNHENLLTGKLFCTHCGTPYYRRESQDKYGNKNSKWVCSGKIKNGAESCPSFPIYEDDIKPILYEVFSDTNVDVNKIVDEYVELYKEATSKSKVSNSIQEQQRIIDFGNKKKDKLLGYNISGKISDEEFIAMNKAVKNEIDSATAKMKELQQQEISNNEFYKQIEDMKSRLKTAQAEAATGIITRQFVDKYIDKIFVTHESDNSAKLDIKIFTGRISQKYMTRLGFRSGHTFLKVCPIRSTKVERQSRIAVQHKTDMLYTYNVVL